MEESALRRPPICISGSSESDSANESRQPSLGSSAHSWGIAEDWNRGVASNRRQVHGPTLLISSALAVPIINNESPTVLVFAWLGVAVALAWLMVKVLERCSRALWKKGISIGIPIAIVFCGAYWNIGERLRPSFVFLTPGPLFNGDTWDFIVSHRGSKTSYNVSDSFCG